MYSISPTNGPKFSWVTGVKVHPTYRGSAAQPCTWRVDGPPLRIRGLVQGVTYKPFTVVLTRTLGEQTLLDIGDVFLDTWF